jgi:hypothetical protein
MPANTERPFDSAGQEDDPAMEELIQRVCAAAGIDTTAAAQATAAILNFLQKEGPSEQVAEVIAQLPGAQALIDAHGGASAETGSGLMGFGGGLMGLAGKLTDAGLSMGQMQALGKEIFAYAREKAGEDAVGEIVGAIPGLGQFV